MFEIALGFQRMAEPIAEVNRIAIPTPLALFGDDSGRFQFRKDTLHGPFGDANIQGEIANSHFRLTNQTDNDVRMVGEEGPPCLRRKLGFCYG